MTDAQTNARKAAKDMREMTPEALVAWAFERKPDDLYRQNLAKLEFERRVVVAAQETAKSTRDSARYIKWSMIVLAVAAVIAALITSAATLFSAWHQAH